MVLLISGASFREHLIKLFIQATSCTPANAVELVKSEGHYLLVEIGECIQSRSVRE